MQGNSPARIWQCGNRQLVLSERPLVMGILNVTPDSFSDGGQNFSRQAALAAAVRMASEGADIIDIGGVSTRPGSTAPDESEELERVLPILREIRKELPDIALSVDTYRTNVAVAAIDAGADIINDVFAARHDGTNSMACAVAKNRTGLVLMHSSGEPLTMQTNPQYGNVADEVNAWLVEAANDAMQFGVQRECIVLDPGIGFGKTTKHNLNLISKGIRLLVQTGFPILIGLSRKRFLGEICNVPEPAQRDSASLAANVLACCAGAHILRVHDVTSHVQAMRIFEAIRKDSEYGDLYDE